MDTLEKVIEFLLSTDNGKGFAELLRGIQRDGKKLIEANEAQEKELLELRQLKGMDAKLKELEKERDAFKQTAEKFKTAEKSEKTRTFLRSKFPGITDTNLKLISAAFASEFADFDPEKPDEDKVKTFVKEYTPSFRESTGDQTPPDKSKPTDIFDSFMKRDYPQPKETT